MEEAVTAADDLARALVKTTALRVQLREVEDLIRRRQASAIWRSVVSLGGTYYAIQYANQGAWGWFAVWGVCSLACMAAASNRWSEVEKARIAAGKLRIQIAQATP
jgi:hypothetical protein